MVPKLTHHPPFLPQPWQSSPPGAQMDVGWDLQGGSIVWVFLHGHKKVVALAAVYNG